MGSQDYSRTLNLKLRELENVARDAGDNELGDCLRKISQSSNSLSSLHRALVDRRRQTKSSTQQHFFNSFRYKQEHLSKHQIQRLVLATEDWEVQGPALDVLKLCLSLWTEHPSLFWVCPATDTNIIQRCYSDLDRIRRVDPIRRKVLLILQYQSVCVEQREHHHTRKSRSRSGPKDGPQAILQRDSGFLTVALRSLSARLWPQLTQEQQNERAKFISEDSRCGSKWALLDEDSIVLSITSAKSSRFERKSWTRIEIAALNAFTKSLPQYQMISEMQKAWEAITSHYREQPSVARDVAARDAALQLQRLSTLPPTQTSQPTSDLPAENGTPDYDVRMERDKGQQTMPTSSAQLGVVPPETDYPDSTAIYGTDGNLPQYQTRDSPSSCQSSGLDSLANAATNLSHSEEAGNLGRRENGSGSYNTNIEQSMPSINYPQSISQGKSTTNPPYQNVYIQSGNTDTRSIVPRSIVFQPADSAPVARPNITGSEQGCQRQLGERRNTLHPTFLPSPNPMSDGFGSNNARQEFVPQAVPHNLDFNCFDSAMNPHGSDFNDLGNVNDEMQQFASQDAAALMSGFGNFGSANDEMQQFASQDAAALMSGFGNFGSANDEMQQFASQGANLYASGTA